MRGRVDGTGEGTGEGDKWGDGWMEQVRGQVGVKGGGDRWGGQVRGAGGGTLCQFLVRCHIGG